MKHLALALLLCAFPSFSEAVCYRWLQSSDMTTHCQHPDDKTWHPIGSSWTDSQCHDCSCNGCCSRPVPQFIGDCVSVFDPDTCTYIGFKRDDPSVLCHFGYSRVLK